MEENRKRRINAVLIVLFTSVISISGTVLFILGWGYTHPEYGISFDANKVSLENIKKFSRVKSILLNDYYLPVSEDAMLEGAISGMVGSLKDPYTVYYTKTQMKSFMESTSGSYNGIGVSINRDNEGILTVVEPFLDSPAYKAGIKRGDKIIKVDDQDVTGIRDEALVIGMIKGDEGTKVEEGTKVKITVFRPSEGKYLDFDIIRKKIKLINIQSEVMEGDVGYIKLIMFDETIAEDFAQHLKSLQGKGIKSLVIDVRDNPGGDYRQVVELVDSLVPAGIIVYTEDRNGKRSVEYSDGKELSLPMKILTNNNSASASEILAGALQDYKKAQVVGLKTYGKGLVQDVIVLNDGSGIKYTIAKYYTPSGRYIQGTGIAPDVEVKLPDQYKDLPASQVPREGDTQLKKAIELIRNGQ